MEQDRLWDIAQSDPSLRCSMFSEARYRYVLRFLDRGARVLDIGVGSGDLERMALAKGVDIHALDPSEKTIERLRTSLGLGDKARSGRVEAIPFADGHFDGIVMSEVLEHLDDRVLAMGLGEVVRALKPGGFLLATTPYRERLEDSRVICPGCGLSFHRWGHVQSFDRQRMRDVLRSAGLAVETLRIDTFIDWRRPGIVDFLKSALRLVLARLGEPIADPHLIAVARKPGAAARAA